MVNRALLVYIPIIINRKKRKDGRNEGYHISFRSINVVFLLLYRWGHDAETSPWILTLAVRKDMVISPS